MLNTEKENDRLYQLSASALTSIKNCIKTNNKLLSKLDYKTYNATNCLYNKTKHRTFCYHLSKITKNYNGFDFFGIRIEKIYYNNCNEYREEYSIYTPSKSYAYFVISTLHNCNIDDYTNVYKCIIKNANLINEITSSSDVPKEDIQAFYIMLETHFHFGIFDKMFQHIKKPSLIYDQETRKTFTRFFSKLIDDFLIYCSRKDELTSFLNADVWCYQDENPDCTQNENSFCYKKKNSLCYLRSIINLESSDFFPCYEFSSKGKRVKVTQNIIDIPSHNNSNIKLVSPHAIVHNLFHIINCKVDEYIKDANEANNKKKKKNNNITMDTYKEKKKEIIKEIEGQLLNCHCEALTKFVLASPYIDFCCRCIEYGINIDTDPLFHNLKLEIDYSLTSMNIPIFCEELCNEHISEVSFRDIKMVTPTIPTDTNCVSFISIILELIKLHQKKSSIHSYLDYENCYKTLFKYFRSLY